MEDYNNNIHGVKERAPQKGPFHLPKINCLSRSSSLSLTIMSKGGR